MILKKLSDRDDGDAVRYSLSLYRHLSYTGDMDRKVSLSMLSGAALLIVLCIIVMGHQGVHVPADDRVPVVDVDDACSITYVTEGSMPEGSPSSYLPGTYLDLPVPYNDGMWFEGWYSDPECTVPFGAVTTSTSGDVTVYAAWSDFDRSGYRFSMDMLIEYGPEGDRTVITGSMSWTYMVLSDSGWYVQREMVQVSDSGTTETTDGYWTGRSSSSDTFRYIGNGEVDGHICEMWSDGKGEVQWIHRNTAVMKIEYRMGSNHQLFILTDQGYTVPDLGFHPSVSVQNGLTVDPVDTFIIGSEGTLTAHGDGFGGWYVDGELVTTDRVLMMDEVDPGMGFEACCSQPYTVSDGGRLDPSDLGLSGDITVTDSAGAIIAEGTGPFDLEPGYYRLSTVVDGIIVFHPVFIEDVRTFVHSWTYDGRPYSVSIDLRLSHVFSDHFGDPMSDHRVALGPEYDAKFLSADNAYIPELVDLLRPMVEGMDDRSRAEFILYFVQTIPYKSDTETRGHEEFFKYPAETLWDGGGDCEDSSFLYASVLSALGYRTAVAMFSDHAMAGVVLEPLEASFDTFTSMDGTVYVFAETTGAGIGFWRTSSEHTSTDVLYVTQSVEGDDRHPEDDVSGLRNGIRTGLRPSS